MKPGSPSVSLDTRTGGVVEAGEALLEPFFKLSLGQKILPPPLRIHHRGPLVLGVLSLWFSKATPRVPNLKRKADPNSCCFSQEPYFQNDFCSPFHFPFEKPQTSDLEGKPKASHHVYTYTCVCVCVFFKCRSSSRRSAMSPRKLEKTKQNTTKTRKPKTNSKTRKLEKHENSKSTNIEKQIENTVCAKNVKTRKFEAFQPCPCANFRPLLKIQERDTKHTKRSLNIDPGGSVFVLPGKSKDQYRHQLCHGTREMAPD